MTHDTESDPGNNVTGSRSVQKAKAVEKQGRKLYHSRTSSHAVSIRNAAMVFRRITDPGSFMPLPPLTFAEVRQVDRDAIQQLGIPGLLLMENAARGACEVIRSMGSFHRIVIVAGPGNNGGDGLAIARLLAAGGVSSETLLLRADKALSADAASNLAFLRATEIPVIEAGPDDVAQTLRELTPQDLVIDALLGTGIRGIVAAPFDAAIQAVNCSSAKVLAIDLPSGMNGDTGQPCGICVEAEETVTFVAEKIGFRTEVAKPFIGRVTVCHIGLPQQWLTRWYEAVSRSSISQEPDERSTATS